MALMLICRDIKLNPDAVVEALSAQAFICGKQHQGSMVDKFSCNIEVHALIATCSELNHLQC